MVGGTPSFTAEKSWCSALRMHRAAANDSLGYRLYRLTATLIPPMVTLLGTPGDTAGYRAQRTFGASSGAASCMAGWTYGQLSWKAPLPAWKSSRTSSSSMLLNDELVTPAVAKRLSSSSARTAPA